VDIMKKALTFAIILSMTTLSFVAPAFAGKAKTARALTIHGTVCPASAPAMRAWAASMSGYGSFAAPYVKGNRGGSCDNFVGYYPTSQSYGHKDASRADSAAISHCEAHKPSGFSGCSIVARSIPLK
jgi:hypothetical protein